MAAADCVAGNAGAAVAQGNFCLYTVLFFMNSALPSITYAELPQLMSRLGIQYGPAGTPSSREWTLDALAGRFAELSSPAAGASLTAAVALVRDAQLRGEPAAWIAVGGSIFYPPDVAESGVDLDAMPVVRAADKRAGARAADHLLRSGGFAVVVMDLGPHHTLHMSIQSRLSGLANRHRTLLLCLTRKDTAAPSIGSLVSIRAEARIEKIEFDRFACRVDVIKDKRRGPGWSHTSGHTYRGPEGLC
jgi:recombination protein RecA